MRALKISLKKNNFIIIIVTDRSVRKILKNNQIKVYSLISSKKMSVRAGRKTN